MLLWLSFYTIFAKKKDIVAGTIIKTEDTVDVVLIGAGNNERYIGRFIKRT
jgi:hypothetical protein